MAPTNYEDQQMLEDAEGQFAVDNVDGEDSQNENEVIEECQQDAEDGGQNTITNGMRMQR